MVDESRSRQFDGAESHDQSDGSGIAVSDVAMVERQGRVTLRDVAKAAGVAPSTVSRVLGGVTTSVAITETTRQQVISRARELGYRPDPLARGLRGSSTGLIGLIVRDLAYPLHGPLIEHVVDAVRARDHHVVIGSSHELGSEAVQLEHIIHTRMCDGIVMLGGLHDKAGIVDDLLQARLPTVGIGLAITNERIPVVRGDNSSGANLVFEHLAALGHRRVGLLQAGEHTEIRRRADAFVAAAAAAGWPSDAVSHILIENDPGEAAAALRSLLNGPRPTAIFATTDHVAYGVLAGAARMGITVPERLSVVGYDDQPMSEIVYPPLTSVRQALQLLAERAVRCVFEIMTSGKAPPESRELVPVSLSVRGSTGPPVELG